MAPSPQVTVHGPFHALQAVVDAVELGVDQLFQGIHPLGLILVVVRQALPEDLRGHGDTALLPNPPDNGQHAHAHNADNGFNHDYRSVRLWLRLRLRARALDVLPSPRSASSRLSMFRRNCGRIPPGICSFPGSLVRGCSMLVSGSVLGSGMSSMPARRPNPK